MAQEFADIRAAIVDKLEDAETIQEVYRTDRSVVAGYPVAIVSPSESEADYHETAPASNKETFVFNVRLLYPFTEGQDAADIALEKAVDEVLTLFRDRTALGSAAEWCTPAPSVWGYAERANGTDRIAVVKIKAVRYVRN
jgi:hypothetical protein